MKARMISTLIFLFALLTSLCNASVEHFSYDFGGSLCGFTSQNYDAWTLENVNHESTSTITSPPNSGN